MKKHLIAAAVAGALAVPAMAQVTISGRIDSGYSQRDKKATSGAKEKGAGVVFNAHTSSRLTFRGTEDLGSGLKANFFVETQLGTSNGVASVQSLDAATQKMGGRGMWVGASGGFGEVRVGLQNSFSKDYVAVTSSAGSNVLGDPTLGSGRAAAGTANAGVLDARYQAISYASPSMSGVKLKAMLVRDQQDTDDTAAGENDLNGTELALEYKAGPVLAALSSGTYKLNATSGRTTALPARGSGTAEQEVKTLVGIATYDLGMAKLFYKYAKAESGQSGGSATTDAEATYNVIGVSAPLGAVTVFANYVTGDYESVAGTTKFDDKGQQFGATYKLSKRTHVYGIYGMAETDITASTNEKDTQFALGLVHAF
jgi:general bacterial porin, GBP family